MLCETVTILESCNVKKRFSIVAERHELHASLGKKKNIFFFSTTIPPPPLSKKSLHNKTKKYSSTTANISLLIVDPLTHTVSLYPIKADNSS